MKDGKKSAATRVVYGALNLIKERGKNPLEVFEGAIQNVSPRMEVRSRRVGGANYQIPYEVKGDHREALAIRWIIEAARQRPSKEYKSMAEKLAAEFQDGMVGVGAAVKKRDDTHRMAEANKAFSHFRR